MVYKHPDCRMVDNVTILLVKQCLEELLGLSICKVSNIRNVNELDGNLFSAFLFEAMIQNFFVYFFYAWGCTLERYDLASLPKDVQWRPFRNLGNLVVRHSPCLQIFKSSLRLVRNELDDVGEMDVSLQPFCRVVKELQQQLAKLIFICRAFELYFPGINTITIFSKVNFGLA